MASHDQAAVTSPRLPRAVPSLRQRWPLALIVGVVLLGLTGRRLLRADETRPDQFQLKAAFVYSFCKYVEWAATKFDSDSAPVVIGVSAKSPLYTPLQDVVRGRTAGGRALSVRICTSLEQAQRVHLLFVSAADENGLAPDLEMLRRSGVLTVGETDRFAERGGVITFVAQDTKLRFKVVLPDDETPPFKLSAQLLKLAVSVNRQRPH